MKKQISLLRAVIEQNLQENRPIVKLKKIKVGKTQLKGAIKKVDLKLDEFGINYRWLGEMVVRQDGPSGLINQKEEI